MGTGLVRTGGSKRAPTRDLLYNEEVGGWCLVLFLLTCSGVDLCHEHSAQRQLGRCVKSFAWS